MVWAGIYLFRMAKCGNHLRTVKPARPSRSGQGTRAMRYVGASQIERQAPVTERICASESYPQIWDSDAQHRGEPRPLLRRIFYEGRKHAT